MRVIRPFALLLAILPLLFAARARAADDLLEELKKVPYKIIFETYQDDNWELFTVNADGSGRANLTRTPETHELYPHASRDGRKVCFVSDEGDGEQKHRSAYVMNMDGSGRALAARDVRDPCWTADGKGIVYLKAESTSRFTPLDCATKGVEVFDLATGEHRAHPNGDLYHLYNICCTPDGGWYLATVHGGMGFGHTTLAVEAQGMKVVNLKIPGCRPDVSADGRRVTWGADDYTLRIGELDFSGGEPKVIDAHDMVSSEKPVAAYHVDWSPDGRYVAFSRGPRKKSLGFPPEMVGIQAPGWDICVADTQATNRWVAITHDGKSNKEPHWVPLGKEQP